MPDTAPSRPSESAQPAPARQRMSAGERRAAIVKAAIALFSKNGFRGATTRQIAAAVGVSEPVLYQHFQTKRELYTAILEHLAGGEPEDKSLCLAGPNPADDRQFFLRLANAIVDWHVKDPSCMRLLFYSALEGHELSDLFYRHHIVPFMEAFSGYIQRRIKEGAFRKMDPAVAARAFVGMIVHYAQDLVMFRFDPQIATRKKTLETMVEIFIHGVKKQ